MFFPGTRSKATTTVLAPVSPAHTSNAVRKVYSPFNRLGPLTVAVSAPQLSIGRTRRSSKSVAYATVSHTNPRIPSPRASPRSRVSSVESVQLVDGRPLGETNPMGLYTSGRLNNPPVRVLVFVSSVDALALLVVIIVGLLTKASSQTENHLRSTHHLHRTGDTRTDH